MSLAIFLFNVLLEGLLTLKEPPMMQAIYWIFPLCPSPSLLLTSFPLLLVMASMVFFEDFLFLGESS